MIVRCDFHRSLNHCLQSVESVFFLYISQLKTQKYAVSCYVTNVFEWLGVLIGKDTSWQDLGAVSR